MPTATDLAAYRIIQEGLTNAHKHGRGPGAELLLDYRPDTLGITIRNLVPADRSTDDQKAAGTGLGLTGIRERAQAAGGILLAGPEPGDTFRLHVRLPLPDLPATMPSSASEGKPT